MNYRGAASSNFLSLLFYFLHIYRPVILVLGETKVSSYAANIIIQKSHVSTLVASKANEFSGGIWIFGMMGGLIWRFLVFMTKFLLRLSKEGLS